MAKISFICIFYYNKNFYVMCRVLHTVCYRFDVHMCMYVCVHFFYKLEVNTKSNKISYLREGRGYERLNNGGT